MLTVLRVNFKLNQHIIRLFNRNLANLRTIKTVYHKLISEDIHFHLFQSKISMTWIDFTKILFLQILCSEFAFIFFQFMMHWLVRLLKLWRATMDVSEMFHGILIWTKLSVRLGTNLWYVGSTLMNLLKMKLKKIMWKKTEMTTRTNIC